MLVVPNEGETKALELLLEVGDLTLRLFSNDVVPGETSTLASFTEVVGGGYAAKTLAANAWTITAGAPATAVQASQTFEFTDVPTGTPNVYGYYVEDAAGIVRWAERFSEAVVPYQPSAGARIRITPRFQTS